MTKKAVVLYAPAIHQGYINFLTTNSHDLYLLDLDLVHEIPRLDRDIRALSADIVQASISSLDLVPTVKVLKKENIPKLLDTYIDFILPDEDVSHHFVEEYLTGKQVTFVDTFLRWDRQASIQQSEVGVNRVISSTAFDKEKMTHAFAEASKSPDWWRQVGACISTTEGKELIAHNSPLPSHDYTLNAFGDPRSNFDAGVSIELSKVIHAESNAIASAAKSGIALNGASIYTTTFPCPPCAKLIATAGISKVYYQQGYSLLDAEDILKSQGIEIVLVKAD